MQSLKSVNYKFFMSDVALSSEEIQVLAKLKESFLENIAEGMSANARMSLVTEMANGLHSLEAKLVVPALGFLLIQYLENHPEHLTADESFASLVYYLRGVSDDLAHELKPEYNTIKSGNRMQALNRMSASQLEAITSWLDVSCRWKCSRRFQFDLEEAKSVWSAYAESHKNQISQTADLA